MFPAGQAFDFTGAGQITLPPSVGAFGTGDFSLAFWVRGLPATSGRQVMSKRDNCGCHQFWDVRGGVSLNMEMYEVCLNEPGNINLGGEPVLDERWHHVVFAREGTRRRGYVDGVLRSDVDTGVVAIINVNDPVRLNDGPCVDLDGTTKFNGALDEIRFYDRALTIDEVRELAGSCAGDVDGDGFVGFADLNAVLSAFNTVSGDAGYNAAADLDGDLDVDFGDLNIVLSAFNTGC